MAETLKVTFTLDRVTVRALARTAKALALPKSRIVRDAVNDYAARLGKLSESERRRLVAVFDQVVGAIPLQPQESADTELRELRDARRGGGRRRP
ncbi:MAG: hypothetical protein ABI609_16105 [Acidobacteriota bacterium]